MIINATKKYKGFLAIGDPHIEAKTPGFRKDDYTSVILAKLKWALNYAAEKKLLPVILGDLFHMPRNNPNRLLVSVMRLFNTEICGIYGNHDVHENRITEDDSISVIAEAGAITLLNNKFLLLLEINGRKVILGGTPWGEKLPEAAPDEIRNENPDFVIWITHHDIMAPGYEEKGYIRPRSLAGIDMVINGHIHRPLEEVKKENTLWVTPGNISRRTRSDASRSRKPSVLEVIILDNEFSYRKIELPHKPFDEIFYDAILSDKDDNDDEERSPFIEGLAELQARKTEKGAGLKNFLEKNLKKFDKNVFDEINKLAEEVGIE